MKKIHFMLSEFFNNSAIYTFASVFQKLLALLCFPFYARYLTVDDIGTFDVLNSFTAILYIVIALEIAQAAGKFQNDINFKKQKKTIFTTALIFTSIVFILCTTTLILFQSSLSNLLGITESADIFIIFAFLAAFFIFCFD